MHDAAFARSVASLTGLGPMRVWSLLVTVFGDLAPDEPLAGPVLSAIMNEISIKPEATRVALHRLRSDGWITSQRSGRTSLYSLTKKGRSDSMAAGPRIYNTPAESGYGVRVIVTRDDGGGLDPADFAGLSHRVFVTGAGTTLPNDAMPLNPEELPDWLGEQIESPETLRDYAALYAVLEAVDRDVDGSASLTPIQSAVLRILIVHAWRRLVLKHPDLPRAAHSKTWRGHDCRALVTTLLDRLPRPAPRDVLAA